MIKNDFDRGFIQACCEIRGIISDAHQQANDPASHKVIDWIWGEVKKIEYAKHGRNPFDEITEIMTTLPKPDSD